MSDTTTTAASSASSGSSSSASSTATSTAVFLPCYSLVSVFYDLSKSLQFLVPDKEMGEEHRASLDLSSSSKCLGGSKEMHDRYKKAHVLVLTWVKAGYNLQPWTSDGSSMCDPVVANMTHYYHLSLPSALRLGDKN